MKFIRLISQHLPFIILIIFSFFLCPSNVLANSIPCGSATIEYDTHIDASEDQVRIIMSNLTINQKYKLHIVDLTHAGHADVTSQEFTATSTTMAKTISKLSLFNNMLKDDEQKTLDVRLANQPKINYGNEDFEDMCKNGVAKFTMAPDPDLTNGVPVTIRADICDDEESLRTALGCIPFEPVALVGWVLRWGIGIGGGIAFLLMAFASFQLMTSTGDPEKIKAGQEMFVSAGAGLLFIIFSVFLLQLIGADILKMPGFGR